jgi:ectoine hydroxylase-related dioxygenase (phytanoyl-CoA dioxygenase family)
VGDARKPSELDDFLFDLRGYLQLERALDADLVRDLNAELDSFPRDLEQGGWYRGAQRRDYTEATGFELHHVVEVGTPFEQLIDHASWRAYIRHYCGEQGTYVQGVFLDECIASIRGAGGHHPMHSGGFQAPLRTLYRYEHGVFRCAQVNIVISLTDIAADDGATMVVPGSHKSNMEHPLAGGYESYARGDRMDALPGAMPVEMRAGDALLFTDSLMHGGGSRTRTDGERRILIYRYGVSWARTRYGYQYSDDLLARVSPRQRLILQPQLPIFPGDARVPDDVVFRAY